MYIDELHELLRIKNGDKLSFFAELLKEYNKICNLTSITDDEGIYYKHFLDSVYPQYLFDEGAFVAEIGSGAGFPSIPLKICRNDLRFTLIESTGKKCDFLRLAKEKLGFSDFEILNIRAEEGAGEPRLREKFDVCVARAVAPLNTLAEYCLPYVKEGGIFAAYKGDADEEIKEALKAIETLGGKIEKTERYELENCGKRSVVVVRKIRKTPAQYPRGRGKERKAPIK